MPKKRGLGRGLEALLGDTSKNNLSEKSIQQTSPDNSIVELPLAQIQAGKYQPRQHFAAEALQELADSIRVQGIIQPIIVRKLTSAPNQSKQYEIIAGERRCRAAKLADLTTVPAIVRELADDNVVAISLIENIQREDLNPMEEARALQRLIQEFDMTHQAIASAVGKSRAGVSNLLRLLALPSDIANMLEDGTLEMGHARALLSLDEGQQRQLAEQISQNSLSVREVETLVRRKQEPQATHSSKLPKSIENPELNAIQASLSDKLALKVDIKQNAAGHGKLIISYKNSTEFAKLMDQIL